MAGAPADARPALRARRTAPRVLLDDPDTRSEWAVVHAVPDWRTRVAQRWRTVARAVAGKSCARWNRCRRVLRLRGVDRGRDECASVRTLVHAFAPRAF